MKKNRTEYHIKYEKKNLKRIPLNVQREYFEQVIKAEADKRGLAINTFIKEAIKYYIENS